MKSVKLFSILLPVITGLIISSCATNPVTGDKELMLLSKSQEKAMGAQSDEQITQYFGLYDDPELQQFISAKGQKMAEVSHRPELDYEFKIVDSPVVNAFAVPGGYVYFTRGIMAQFNNEAEFAGVLGHEIGHVAARHSAKQYSQQMVAQIGLVVGSVISEDFREYAGVAQQGLSLLFLKFSRNHERQSDKLGVEYSTKIGYDAEEMAGFFNVLDRMNSESGATVPTFLSTHPDPGNRRERVLELAKEYQNKLNKHDLEENREAYLRMIDGMIYGKDPKQGYVEESTFYHPVMKFKYDIPRTWAVQNSPQQVQMAPESGEAMLALSIPAGNSAESAAQNFVDEHQLEVLASEKINLNGFSAIRMLTKQAQDNSEVNVLAYFIEGDENLYQFIGVTNTENYNTYRDNFIRAIESFSRLSDPDKINVKPKRIKVEIVQSGAKLRDIFSRYGVPSAQMTETAILNNMELDDFIEAGTLIKTIQ